MFVNPFDYAAAQAKTAGLIGSEQYGRGVLP